MHTKSSNYTPSLIMFFSLLSQVYKAWVNCCLAQFGDNKTINDLAGDLKDGVVFCQLIKLTTGYEIAQQVNQSFVIKKVQWNIH